ncbi:MAG: hypothetical protein KDC38_18480 [Planctomycetes bacterium]|nr:hypothetical protein [Planctomycetota bacterium]
MDLVSAESRALLEEAWTKFLGGEWKVAQASFKECARSAVSTEAKKELLEFSAACRSAERAFAPIGELVEKKKCQAARKKLLELQESKPAKRLSFQLAGLQRQVQSALCVFSRDFDPGSDKIRSSSAQKRSDAHSGDHVKVWKPFVAQGVGRHPSEFSTTVLTSLFSEHLAETKVVSYWIRPCQEDTRFKVFLDDNNTVDGPFLTDKGLVLETAAPKEHWTEVRIDLTRIPPASKTGVELSKVCSLKIRVLNPITAQEIWVDDIALERP